MGQLRCLNVGAGDIKITFDTQDAAEAIRARRMITDMLRRGYALLIEVDGAYVRALDFKEDVGEYVVADFDPEQSVITQEKQDGTDTENKITNVAEHEVLPKIRESEISNERPDSASAMPGKRGRKPNKSIPMSKANAVAVGRSAGG